MNEISVGKLEWFGGNKDALNMFRLFVDLTHTWDDLVDKDKDVPEAHINHAFLSCLVYLQANPFYRSIQDQVIPMWITVVSAYTTANQFEKEKDEHGLEISHGLRYATGHIVAYAVHVCVGEEKAKELMPEIWRCIYFERYEEYRKEHLDAV
jgi:hypothetical protein